MRTLKQFYCWLNEGKGKFSLTDLKSIPSDSFEHQVNEIKTIREYLILTLGMANASGETREIWDIGNNTIIKLAIEEEGISHNLNEIHNAECLGPSYAIKIFDHHHNGIWIIEEKLQPLSEQRFVAEIGKRIDTFLEMKTDIGYTLVDTSMMIADIFEHLVEGYEKEKYEALYPLFNESLWVQNLVKALQQCEVNSQDLHYRNWGIRPGTGELIILDLGF